MDVGQPLWERLSEVLSPRLDQGEGWSTLSIESSDTDGKLDGETVQCGCCEHFRRPRPSNGAIVVTGDRWRSFLQADEPK